MCVARHCALVQETCEYHTHTHAQIALESHTFPNGVQFSTFEGQESVLSDPSTPTAIILIALTVAIGVKICAQTAAVNVKTPTTTAHRMMTV